MALFLIHCKPNGEPVGIWDDTGAHVYADPTYETRGQLTFDSRGSKNPWSSFVDGLTRGTPHASFWQSDDTPLDANQALDEARSQFRGLNKPTLR